MGYWESDSRTRPDGTVIWGDQPADILSDALWQIVACFAKDMGRLPTKEEMIQGIEFSLGGPNGDLLALPEAGDESAEIPAEVAKVLDEDYWVATRGDVSPDEHRWQAGRRISVALDGLRGKYEWNGELPTEVEERRTPAEGEVYVSPKEAAAQVNAYLADRAKRGYPELVDQSWTGAPALNESALRSLVRGYAHLAKYYQG